MQTLLVTLIELFLNYKPSAGRGEPGTRVARQINKSKQIDKKIDQGALWWDGCSQTYLNVFPMTLATGGSGGRAWKRGTPSPM
jgi:hypothetical protein